MYNKYKKYRKRTSKKEISLNINPGSDPKLKKIFRQIGIPEQKIFKPDSFQIEALNSIENCDCLVTAPTGSGKTWIAEQAISKIYNKKGRAWYASPLKALSNTIYAHFIKIFGSENVGILTGDKKENPDAQIIVGTTEILRNQLYDAMHKGQDLNTDFVVLDEAHFLGDEDRGVVWEETMIYLPDRIPLLMLSATIGNAKKIANWLSSIRSKECVVVEAFKRAVPLYPLFFHPSGTLFPLISKKSKEDKSGIYRKVAKYIKNSRTKGIATPGNLPPMNDILKVLQKYNLLPAIFFLKSRADCDKAIELCTQDLIAKKPLKKENLSKKLEELKQQFPHIKNHKQLWMLEHMAVGSHHSGQLPIWKLIVEILMSEGLLDAVFATSTVAAGVNFPARTVVVLNSDRYNGTEFLPLSSTEFHQMTGRAGRRGMDKIGFAVMLPGKFMDIKLIAKLIKSPSSNIRSQIKINFSMVLNLLLSHTPKQIKELLEKSFASWLMMNQKKKKKSTLFIENNIEYLWRDFLHHLSFLKSEGFITEDNKLTPDGEWTSQLRIDQPLLVAECFRLGIVPEDDPILLAALMACFVNDREMDDSFIKEQASKKLETAFFKIKQYLRPFIKNMLSQGFEVKPLYLQPALIVYLWASDLKWESVVQNADMSEGDVARLILRTADNLRHIRNLKNNFPIAAKTSEKSIELIMREPLVDYYDA